LSDVTKLTAFLHRDRRVLLIYVCYYYNVYQHYFCQGLPNFYYMQTLSEPKNYN